MGYENIWRIADSELKPEKFDQPAITFDYAIEVVRAVCQGVTDEFDKRLMQKFAAEGEQRLHEWLDVFYPLFSERAAQRSQLCLFLKRLITGELSREQHISKNGAETAIAQGTTAKELISRYYGGFHEPTRLFEYSKRRTGSPLH